MLERPLHRGADLPEVMRRDVRGHADGDAGCAVDEQVGDPARQDVRLLRAAVVVGREVDGVLADVTEHLHGKLGEPRLGVAHGRWRVVAGRAEVAVAVDQRHPQRPGLGQPDQRVVDRRVAVRVVVAHDVADDAGAFEVPAVGAVAPVVHRIEHPAVHRLQSVADIGQGAADDDRHRVVEIAALHLDFDADGFDAVGRRARGVDGHWAKCPFCARGST